MRVLLVALSAVALLAAAAPATSAGAPERDPVAEARAALAAVRDAGATAGGARLHGAGQPDPHAARGLTHLLKDLYALRPFLQGEERREADAWFARPTDGTADMFGNGYTVPEATPIETEHFVVHYVTSSPDASSAGYAQEVAGVMEQVWTSEVTELGWPGPASDGALGGDGRVDVYLAELADFAFGYAAPDGDNTCQPTTCSGVHGFLVLDNDYVGFPPNPAGALRATAAHEFNHVLHFATAYNNDNWMYEASGVWMELAVYPEIDGRSIYLEGFAERPTLPITDFGQNSGGFERSYGLYVLNLWLSSQFGPSVVRDAWTAAAARSAHSLDGYEEALRARGTTFTQQFVRFAAATAEWQTAGFPQERLSVAYPDVRRDTAVGSGTFRTSLDHTSYVLADIPPGGVSDELSVTVTGPAGVAGGIALVVRDAGEVGLSIDDTLSDGSASVTVSGASGAERITLALVNADTTLASPKDGGDFDAGRLPLNYAADAVGYQISVAGAGEPPPPPDTLPMLTDGGRIDGGGNADPIGQAIAVSQALFADGEASRVVLATADRFPDALAGSALAGSRGPILFTSGSGGLDERTRAEIARVTGGAGEVVTLGGTAAVSEQASSAARAAGGNVGCAHPIPPDCRFAGSGRHHTAALVAQAVWDENPDVLSLALVARADDFADALTGGAFAAAYGAPILLTDTGSADPFTVEFLQRNAVAFVKVLGGTAAVSDTTFRMLPARTSRIRVAGGDRTATAVQVWSQLWSEFQPATGGVVLVNVRDPNGWQTALSAAVASAVYDAPQLGVESPPASLSEPTRQWLQGRVPAGFPITAFGGTSLVSDQQLAEARVARG